MEIVFWISLLFVVYTYLGYPLIIVIWSKLFPKPVQLNMESFEWPRVTMIIIAYNEAATILRKINNCRELDYPKELLEICIVSDGSTDSTNDILMAQPDMRIIIDETNQGKPYQINRAVRETQSDIIVFADARQTFDKDAIKMLVRNFSDPKIGAVSGELVFASPDCNTEISIGLYWMYEKIIRKAESSVKSTIGVTGAIYAIRRLLFTPIADDTILDDVEIPLHVYRKGYRVIFEPEAKAFDAATSDVRHEFQRKVRTLTGNYQIFSRNRWLFSHQNINLMLQTLSHKFFRLCVSYSMICLAFSSSIISGTFYKTIFIVQIVFYTMGFLALLIPAARNNRFVNVIAVFLVLNAASIKALLAFIFSKYDTRWKN